MKLRASAFVLLMTGALAGGSGSAAPTVAGAPVAATVQP